MKTNILTVGDQLVVTEIKQFVLPARVHFDDLYRVVYYDQGRFEAGRYHLDFCHFSGCVTPAGPSDAEARTAREDLVYQLIRWLQDYDVNVGHGVYFQTDLTPYIK